MSHLRSQGVCVDEGQRRIALVTDVSWSGSCRYFAQQSGYTPQIIVHGDGSQCSGQTRGANWTNIRSVELFSGILSQNSSKLIEDLLSRWGVSGVVVYYPLLDLLTQLSEQRAARKRVGDGPLWEHMRYLTSIP